MDLVPNLLMMLDTTNDANPALIEIQWVVAADGSQNPQVVFAMKSTGS